MRVCISIPMYICVCGHFCIRISIYLIGLVGRVFAEWSGRPGFNPRSCHTKDFKNGT